MSIEKQGEYSKLIEAIKMQGVPEDAIINFHNEGYTAIAFICPSPIEQIEYENQWKKIYGEDGVRFYPLRGGGKAYFVKKAKNRSD